MDETELSPIFRGGKGHLPPPLTRYGAPLNVVWNQLSYPIASMISGGIPNAIKNGTLQQLVGVYAAFGLANALVAAMRGKFSGEDGDEDEKFRLLAYYLIASPLAESVPLFSGGVSWAAESVIKGEMVYRYPQRMFPLGEITAQALVEWGDAIARHGEKNSGKRYKKAVWDSIFAGMYGAGLPANQLKKIRTAFEEETFWPVIGFRREGKKK
jgi:hypothetical protein